MVHFMVLEQQEHQSLELDKLHFNFALLL